MNRGRGQQSQRIEKISSEEILIEPQRYLMRARSRGEYLFRKNQILRGWHPLTHPQMSEFREKLLYLYTYPGGLGIPPVTTLEKSHDYSVTLFYIRT